MPARPAASASAAPPSPGADWSVTETSPAACGSLSASPVGSISPIPIARAPSPVPPSLGDGARATPGHSSAPAHLAGLFIPDWRDETRRLLAAGWCVAHVARALGKERAQVWRFARRHRLFTPDGRKQHLGGRPSVMTPEREAEARRLAPTRSRKECAAALGVNYFTFCTWAKRNPDVTFASGYDSEARAAAVARSLPKARAARWAGDRPRVSGVLAELTERQLADYRLARRHKFTRDEALAIAGRPDLVRAA